MFFLSLPSRKPARSASCGTELHVVQGDVETWKNKDRAGGRAGDCPEIKLWSRNCPDIALTIRAMAPLLGAMRSNLSRVSVFLFALTG